MVQPEPDLLLLRLLLLQLICFFGCASLGDAADGVALAQDISVEDGLLLVIDIPNVCRIAFCIFFYDRADLFFFQRLPKGFETDGLFIKGPVDGCGEPLTVWFAKGLVLDKMLLQAPQGRFAIE